MWTQIVLWAVVVALGLMWMTRRSQNKRRKVSR